MTTMKNLNIIDGSVLTLTTDSLVWAISEITPSVIINNTKYCEPSVTSAAQLNAYTHTRTHTHTQTQVEKESRLHWTFYSSLTGEKKKNVKKEETPGMFERLDDL